jgi:hypothetical protein
MSNAELNSMLKLATGKKTVLEAKMEVGRRLGIVYALGWSKKGYVEPWEVVLNSRGYTVLAGEPVPAANNEIIPPGEAVMGMIVERALEYVHNPALLFVRDREWLGTIMARWDSRPQLTPWIHPNDIPRLWKEAQAAEEESAKRNGRKPVAITPLDSDKYLRSANEGAEYCPKCEAGGRFLHWSDPILDQGTYCDVVVQVKCRECDFFWQERYKLAGIEPLIVEEEFTNAEKV